MAPESRRLRVSVPRFRAICRDWGFWGSTNTKRIFNDVLPYDCDPEFRTNDIYINVGGTRTSSEVDHPSSDALQSGQDPCGTGE